MVCKNKSLSIAVLGCGWLGLPLALALQQLGHAVKGATTTPEKVFLISSAHFPAYEVVVDESGIRGNIHQLFENVEILLINIPPKASLGNYATAMQHLAGKAEEAGIKHILFVSSTSVYGDCEGEVNEDTQPAPETQAAKQLYAAEQLLLENPAFSTTVVRFGGLIGDDRHPVKHLAGRTGIADPDVPVNLVHQGDCIALLSAIIEAGAWGEVVNGVAPQHPSRKEYYTAKAVQMGLEPPVFLPMGAQGKKVVSNRMKRLPGFAYEYLP